MVLPPHLCKSLGPKHTIQSTITHICTSFLVKFNQCANCRAINEENFLDVLEIDAASNRGIDEIRDLRDKVRFAPSQGKRKVYIIDEVHMLTNAHVPAQFAVRQRRYIGLRR